jgi:DNA-directed RNA polymerase subunit M/transcription elongation factor TFIIS
MTKPIYETVICRRCGHRWTVDLAKLGKPETVLYRDNNTLRIETFRLVCPNCGNIEMLEVTFEERRHA